MTKPIIAVDVDDVLVDSAPQIISNYNQRWGTSLTINDWYSGDSAVWGTLDMHEAVRRVDEYAQSPAYFQIPAVLDAAHALQELSKTYELHVLTGRSDVVSDATEDWLHKYFPQIFISVNFSNLYNKDKHRPKGEMALELGASYIIDDYALNVISAADHGLQAVLFGDYPWNRTVELPAGVTRCRDWSAVLEYFANGPHRA